MVAQFIDTVKVEMEQPFQLRLADSYQLGPLQLLTQQHTQHGRLLGVFQGDGGEVHPGRIGPGGKQHLIRGLPCAESHQDLLPVGLVDLIHPGP